MAEHNDEYSRSNDENNDSQDLSDNIKQAMFQDHKIAYSEETDTDKEEAKSTGAVGGLGLL